MPISSAAPPQFLRRKAAAQYLHERYGFGSMRWLAVLACKGGGPVFQKFGKIPLYTQADLDTWALARMSQPMTSTSQYSTEK